MSNLHPWDIFIVGYFLSMVVSVLLVKYVMKRRTDFGIFFDAQTAIECSMVPMVNFFVPLFLLCSVFADGVRFVSTKLIANLIIKE